jgi:hypothetical protein
VVVVLVAAGVIYWQFPKGNSPERISLDGLDNIQLRLDENDIPFLKEVALKHPDNYVRERALSVMTDIAVRDDAVNEVTDFLKGIAFDEKNDAVRSAAYTNISLIREMYPLQVPASLDLEVEGVVIQGNLITLVARAQCGIEVREASVGIMHILGKDSSDTSGIRLTSPNPVNFSLSAGKEQDTEFVMELRNPGEYRVRCSLKLSFDRVDYVTLEKELHLRVEKTGGSYEITD